MSAVETLLAAVRRRERLADAARGLSRWALPAGLVIAAVCLVAVRRGGAPFLILWLTALPLPAVAIWAFVRGRSVRATARRVDAHYGLDDEIGSAYELGRSPPRGVSGEDPRTRDIIEILRSKAEARAASLDPRPVVPLVVPGPRLLDGLALLAVVGASLLPRPEPAAMQTWFAAPQLDALLSLPARAGLDLALADPLRQNLRGLSDDEDRPAQIAEKILEVLDKLESGELDRAEAFAALEELEALLREAEDELQAQLDEDPGMLADAVRDLAEALEEHEITEDAGQALDDGRADDAEQALDEAADKAESGTADEQQALREAMAAAERRLSEAAKKKSDTDAQLDDAERRLRREQKKKNPEDPQEHERRLSKMKERVEQLRRQQEREQAAERRLDELRRNAADAANGSKSGEQRKRSMQKLSRGASGAARKGQQSSRMRQIRDAMDEAKTFVRRAGKQGDAANRRREQFRRFSKAAQGDKGKKGKQGKKGNSLVIEGQVGDGEPDMMMEGDGDGQDGQDGQGQDDGQGDDGQAQGQDSGEGTSPGGDGVGDGSIDGMGDERGLDVRTKTVRVDARPGRGVSRAEVIQESSQQGFATESYRDVFTDYRRFAQSALDNEALPPAQRRAVKRYYQLISPRN